jgi:dTDP-4-dehydrorhamnose reductase
MESRVLVLGSSGMAGHIVTLALSAKPGLRVFNAGPRRKIFDSTLALDTRDPPAVERLLKQTNPHFVINCVGVLIKASEEDALDAIWHNAYFPRLLSAICARDSRKLIHLSTDCVFSGKNGPYREADFRDGDLVYDRTKALGEVTNGRDLTIRTSIVGPELKENGPGLFNWFMAQRGTIKGYAKVFWSGVTTMQLAVFLLYLITSNPELSGLVHYATPGGISKLELLSLFNDTFHRGIGIDSTDIPMVDKRLIDTRMDFQCKPPAYAQQISAMKLWIDDHARLYPHYKPLG